MTDRRIRGRAGKRPLGVSVLVIPKFLPWEKSRRQVKTSPEGALVTPREGSGGGRATGENHKKFKKSYFPDHRLQETKFQRRPWLWNE